MEGLNNLNNICCWSTLRSPMLEARSPVQGGGKMKLWDFQAAGRAGDFPTTQRLVSRLGMKISVTMQSMHNLQHTIRHFDVTTGVCQGFDTDPLEHTAWASKNRPVYVARFQADSRQDLVDTDGTPKDGHYIEPGSLNFGTV